MGIQNTDAESLFRPKVSVVVPARNEEANLERCLRSLVVQRGVAFEIIVVDDDSTDRTREIAESFTRVKACPFIAANADLVDVIVLSARPLPQGWAGKANACATGAEIAQGDWILFTDADTEHLESSLTQAVAEAEVHSVGVLTYSPEQILTGFDQHALMPLIFSELATVYKPSEVCDPKSPTAAANGQYLLIRRDVYDRVGGFSSVAGSLLEDVALARQIKASGEAIRFRLGTGAVRTHMYRDWKSMQAGWTKNLALLFPNAQRLAFIRMIEFLGLILFPVFSLLSAVAVRQSLALVEAVLGAILWAAFLNRVRRAHFGLTSTIVSVLGLPLFSTLLLRSAAAHARGSVAWKGRTYAGSVTSKPETQSNEQANTKKASLGK
jgi:glycosyltransferase involved in cell wall biosynthesis